MAQKSEPEVYDTYIFVHEEQPFNYVRVLSSSDTAVRARAKMDALKAERKTWPHVDNVKLARHARFYQQFLNWVTQSSLDENETCAETIADLNEAKIIAPDPTEWEALGKGDEQWAPLELAWTSGITYILNTWC